MKIFSTALTILIISFAEPCFAQGDAVFDGSRHKVGFISGYGDQRWLSVSYDYRCVFYQFQYYYTILPRKKWSLDAVIQPQFNTTMYRHVDGYAWDRSGYEYGVNVGVLLRRNFANDFVSLYFLGSIGPHYVSGTPERQVEGFIFSDNLFVGINLKLIDGLYLDFRPGFRHVSNAGLEHPSLGLNNVVLSGGIFIVL